MLDQQTIDISNWSGGASHDADLSENQFNDSLNVLLNQHRTRLVVRPGMKQVISSPGATQNMAIIGVRDFTGVWNERDEILMGSCTGGVYEYILSGDRGTCMCSRYQGINAAGKLGNPPYAMTELLDRTFILGGNGHLANTNDDSGCFFWAVYDCSLGGDGCIIGFHTPGNVLTSFKGRLFVGQNEKLKNSCNRYTAYSVVRYSSVIDTCTGKARYEMWSPADPFDVQPSDGGCLTIPTSLGSRLTALVGNEQGLVLFFNDRIMLWQWPDTSFPHDFAGNARIETLYYKTGATHQNTVQAYRNDIYFVGQSSDGATKLMKLDNGLTLSELSGPIDREFSCYTPRADLNTIASAMYRGHYVLYITRTTTSGHQFYAYNLSTNSWFPLDFTFKTGNTNDIISMASSPNGEKMYIAHYNHDTHVARLYTFPYGVMDSHDGGAGCDRCTIKWNLVYDNIDLGDAQSDKFMRDIRLELDSPRGAPSVRLDVYDADCHFLVSCSTPILTTTKAPTAARQHTVLSYEVGKRLKNFGIKLSGCYPASSVATGVTEGEFGLNNILIRFQKRERTVEA